MLGALLIVLVTIEICCSLEQPSLGEAFRFEFRLDNMQSCPDEPQATIFLENVSMDPFNRTTLVTNGQFRVKELVQGSIKGIIDLTKCDSKQQYDSCQHFITVVFDDLCAELPKKNESWTPFFAHIINFQPDCPLKPGTYEIKDAPVDLSFLADNPIIFGYWRARQTAMEGEKLISCTTISFNVIKPRPK
ncbi:uncharacterized protein [Anabrus simplex]|uniref:uncharacterized protein n=1 Tax=Anabrus simplex TaxID=316456 RepID=UPI0034DD6DF1